MCESKENKGIFFSCEIYTNGFIIVFGESQVRHKLENYYNWFNNSELIRSLRSLMEQTLGIGGCR